MPSLFLFIGALSAALSVGMGAFGAHILKETLTPEMLSVYQTAVTYQMWHSLALIAVALMQQQIPKSPYCRGQAVCCAQVLCFFRGVCMP